MRYRNSTGGISGDGSTRRNNLYTVFHEKVFPVHYRNPTDGISGYSNSYVMCVAQKRLWPCVKNLGEKHAKGHFVLRILLCLSDHGSVQCKCARQSRRGRKRDCSRGAARKLRTLVGPASGASAG